MTQAEIQLELMVYRCALRAVLRTLPPQHAISVRDELVAGFEGLEVDEATDEFVSATLAGLLQDLGALVH